MCQKLLSPFHTLSYLIVYFREFLESRFHVTLVVSLFFQCNSFIRYFKKNNVIYSEFENSVLIFDESFKTELLLPFLKINFSKMIISAWTLLIGISCFNVQEINVLSANRSNFEEKSTWNCMFKVSECPT